MQVLRTELSREIALSGLVDQLQADAMDDSVSLTSLLRKVKVAAVKLGLNDTAGWVGAELDGYRKRPPEYRILVGRLKWWNPYRGWLHVGFPDQQTADNFQTWPVHEAIPSLEATLGSDDTIYQMPMPPAVTNALSESVGFHVTSAICEVGRGALVGIVQHVRGSVLDWALELERAGITGQGLTFSVREQETAKAAHISIGTFHGSFNSGELSGPNARVHQNSVDNSIHMLTDDSIFDKIEAEIRSSVDNKDEQDRVIKELVRIREAVDKPSKLVAYQQFITSAANHMTILAPFLPILGAVIGH